MRKMILAAVFALWALLAFTSGQGSFALALSPLQTGTQPPSDESSTSAPAKPATASPTVHKPTAKKSRRRKAKPLANDSTTAENTPQKVVVPNGSTSEPPNKLAPRVTPTQASQEEKGTTQLLDDADSNLKKAGGQSLESQRETIGQIRQYMEQAKAASDAGDLERAHNLAVKANLLSKELLPH